MPMMVEMGMNRMMVETGRSLKHTLSIPMVMPRLTPGWPEERLRGRERKGGGECVQAKAVNEVDAEYGRTTP